MVAGLLSFHIKLLILAIAANLGLQIYLAVGEPKFWHEIDWLDVIAEGGAAALCLVWLWLMLHSRPGGRVTNLLTMGLGCVFFSWWMDCLDEFIRLPENSNWGTWLESAPMPVGLILLTIGLYHWHHEQKAISAQMAKRERLFREHKLFDKLTPLGGADYLRRQLSLSLEQAKQNQQPLSLIAVDLDNFNAINRRNGQQEGDLVLQTVSQLLLLNIRQQDLLCRLAGDRFVVLLPNTGEHQAEQIARELQMAVAHLAYRTRQGERLSLTASVAVTMAMQEAGADSLLKRLNQLMASAKQTLFAQGAS